MAVQLKLVIVAELLKQFKNLNDGFLSVIRDHSDKVDNDTINFHEIGADPAVLINNTTYPIAVNGRTDTKKPVSLYKLDTENTSLTQDELHALAYDKKSSVREQHLNALYSAYLKLGVYSLAPAADAADTPVVVTTGATVSGRKRITVADLVSLKERCDNLAIPLESRNLILSSEHVNDLLLIDQSFKDRYYATETGKILKNVYGFNMWENINAPVYDNTLGAYTKNAYGAAAASSDRKASVFFSNVNAMKALGSTEVFYTDASQDPINRKSIIGFRQWGIVSPVNAKGIGAIVSA